MLLNGIKIVSFCHYLQGPAGAQYLADLGAEVIKVEPLTGAFERHWSGAGVYIDDISSFYLCGNRNARSIAIDLKHPEGNAVAKKLIAQADVVIENFRPGVFDRLGFDKAELDRLNPTLIYASASGFGSSGPLVGKPGQDALIQARSGLIGVTGNAGESAPTPIGASIVDQHGGALLAMGILAALIRKMREGVGTRVEASLLAAGIDLQGEALVTWFAGNIQRERLKRDKHLSTWFHEAPYGVFPATDGHILMSNNKNSTVANLAKIFDSEPLRAMEDLDRYENRDVIAAEIAKTTKNFSIAELEERLAIVDIWCAPITYYDQLLSDPQCIHYEMFREVEVRGRNIRLVNHPNRYDGKVPELRVLALDIGEHTREILAEHGFDDAGIDQLIDSRAVVVNRSARQTELGASAVR